MSIAPSSFRRRIRRASSVEGPQGFWGGLLETISRSEVLVRLGLCLIAAVVLLILLQGWSEPFSFRLGSVAPRGVVARFAFEKPDLDRTRAAQERATSQVRVVYAQDRSPLLRIRDGLKNRVAEIAAAETLAGVSRDAWLEFAPETASVLERLPVPVPGTKVAPVQPPIAPEPPDLPIPQTPPLDESPGATPETDENTPVDSEQDSATAPSPTPETATQADAGLANAVVRGRGQPSQPGAAPAQPAVTEFARQKLEAEQAFTAFRNRVGTKEKLLEFNKAIDRAFAPLEQQGVLEKIQHGLDDGSQTEIDVHPIGNVTEMLRVQVAEVLLGEAKIRLKGRLAEELGSGPLTDRVFTWIDPRLTGSLELDGESTAKAKTEAIEKTPKQFVRYAAGDLLVPAGQEITADELTLLKLEHDEAMLQQPLGQQLGRAISMLGLFIAMFTLAGFYLHLHHRAVLNDLGHVATLLTLVVATTAVCFFAANDAWRAEILPLLVFAMTVAIAYDEDLSLLLVAQVALVLVTGLGHGLADYITLTAASAATIFWMGQIRSRSKLIYVGLWAGAVAIATQIGANLLEEHPLDLTLLFEAARTGVWTLLAGFLMTGLLPFIEKTFGVLTDLSLLEIGDVAHPLLQELVRRAPGTYNHSINVASIGEAAAEAIGARGLLVRVGGYFHDVGKMLKPAYYVENQNRQENRHETLVPAMSSLIIIAHVKEGAELARQYNLPQPIIDLLLEHHGTTLVEYFYRRAAEKSQNDPHGGGVDEQTFRYPGPRPSTRESAVLMLSDAVESASRSLSEPTPARITSLVHDLAMKRLLDGQFEDCGLTLEELRLIEQSLVKSLTAVYHGRVKYPDQRTA
ncbi:MAG: HDIG domain-containing protein [Planctomycetia bacterium]|nr:HDIG domain-containing protein [Planctomycetia bacterium]